MAPESPVSSTRRKVGVLEPIDPAGVSLLERSGFQVESVACSSFGDHSILASYDALIVRKTEVTESFLVNFPSLKLLVKHGTGLDSIDLAAATDKGVEVRCIPGVNAPSVAEHALALMLAVAKELVPAHQAIKDGDSYLDVRGRIHPMDLRGKVLGLIGVGHIGGELGLAAHYGLGMSVIGYDVDPASVHKPVAYQAFERVLKTADVVSIHVPLNTSTRHMIGAVELGLIKPGSIIINTSRGAVLDESALMQAVDDGHFFGVGVDCFSTPDFASELAGKSSVVTSPHSAALGDESVRKMSLAVAEQVVNFFAFSLPSAGVMCSDVNPSK